MIKDLNERYHNSLLPRSQQVNVNDTGRNGRPQFLRFEDIKDSCTGYGRMVFYKSNNSNPDPQYNELEMVEEGHFVRGLKDGYCRSISAVNGTCAAGFHRNGVPSGKWVSYKSNGEFSHP